MMQLTIIGAGGHATSCADVAVSCGYKDLLFVDSKGAEEGLLGFPVVPSLSSETLRLRGGVLFVAIGHNARRGFVVECLKSEFSNCLFATLVHPSAFVSRFASVGIGTIVMPNATVGPNSTIGDFCILNTGSSLDHDGLMSDFSSLAPGAVCGGSVSIGRRSAISIGAIITHRASIGSDSVVGANSYVHQDVPARVVSWGCPASVKRMREPLDPYL